MKKQIVDHYANANAIRRVLLSDWNPIGGNVPEDEYDSYIPKIYVLMQQGTGIDALASHLKWIENERMGSAPDSERNRRVAILLLSIMA